MEKNFLPSNALMNTEFVTDQKVDIHYHDNFELLYVMNGKVKVQIEDENYELSSKDMIVINVNRNHSYEAVEESFCGRILISYSIVRDLVGQDMVLFWCNSAVDQNSVFGKIRTLLTKIFNQVLIGENNKIYLNSMYYQLLYMLTGNFLLTSKDAKFDDEQKRNDDRLREIFAYIRMNYTQSISLQDIADHLFLSPTYLSKYIKKKCNINFGELINTVRMGHAMEELMYSDSSIMKIAMDNGFASVAAYNKAFKEAYDMTPSEFRKKKLQKQKENKQKDEKRKREIEEKWENYLNENPLRDENKKKKDLLVKAKSNSGNEVELNHVCGRVINVGTALDMTKSVFQNQILMAKEKLGIEYVRFWDIYAPELFIDIHAPKEKLYFGHLDIIIDFLIQNGMKPYIELGFKPIRLLGTVDEAVVELERTEHFENDEEMQIFYEHFMRHLVKRYGNDKVKNWYFEFWEKEALAVTKQGYQYSPNGETEHEHYFHDFDIISRSLKKYLPEVQLGGAEFPLQHYGGELFTDILRSWKTHSEQPLFISLSSYPYQQEKEGNTYYEKRSTDADFVLHNVEKARQAMKNAGFEDTKLFVSEYSFSLSNRNAINDSCIKAAFLMQNAIACLGKVELLGHWLFSDMYADYNDTQEVLFGGCGLLTKNGIPKPSFYALEFLNKLYDHVIIRSRNCIVTQNNRGAFSIACHNYKNLNFNYFMLEENQVKVKDISNFADDQDDTKIHFVIEHVKNSIYYIKQHRVNESFGSVQNEWSGLNRETELNMEEMEYLNKISTPKLTINEVAVADEKIDLSITLMPNEIQLIHIREK